MGIKGARRYKDNTVREALKAIDSGMSASEVGKIMEIPTTTIHSWVARSKGKLYWKKESSTVAPPVQASTPHQPELHMSLEDFIYLLEELVIDYRKTKARLHELEKSADNWKVMAGKLNEQLETFSSNR